ncbi:ABC transporter substrate-binding protein [Paenibacillus senegalensis]|uniref:ABC transporter substrate-binding protein n=1 Tax=Paenibacillus senegalensis TaxID=1465766 RepID=UPI000289EDEF|nr:extracellular solute-binding protein [Paenibacillus senegalensis]
MVNKNRKIWPAALSLSLLVPALSACSFGAAPSEPEPTTLRIGMTNSWYDENYFRQEYTELFELQNKHVTIEFVPVEGNNYYSDEPQEYKDPVDLMKEMMQGPNPPDVVMFTHDQFPMLVEENLLSPLDPFISRDNFKVDDIVPAVIDSIKSVGNNQIYALSPTFYSSALIYNKGMFDDRGVSYPEDNMTWNEVFDLARRVSPGDGSKFGFNFSSYNHGELYYTMQNYSSMLRLRTFSEDGEQMTVNTDKWEEVWSTVINLANEKVIPNMTWEDMEKMEYRGPFSYNDFLSNRLAMSIISFSEIREITNANKNAEQYPDYTPIDWDLVTLPESDTSGTNQFGLQMLMAVNANAANPEVAWDYISFMNGEDWARLKSRSSYNLISNKNYTASSVGDEYNIGAFYNITPSFADYTEDYSIYEKYPNIYEVMYMGQEHFNNAKDGNIGVREALQKWEQEGNEALLRMRENPEEFVPPGMGGGVEVIESTDAAVSN